MKRKDEKVYILRKENKFISNSKLKLTKTDVKKLLEGSSIKNKKLFSLKKNDYYQANLKFSWVEAKDDKNVLFGNFEFVK